MNQGLIHALLLDGQGGARLLDDQQVNRWQPEQGCLWLHFDYRQPDTRRWLEQHSELDKVAVSALLSEATRPRATGHGQGLLIALREVNLNPGADPEDMVAMRLWLEPQRIISTRNRQLASVQTIAARLAQGKGPANSDTLLAELAFELQRPLGEIVEELDDQIDELETRFLDGILETSRGELMTQRRRLIEFRRYLSPQREALGRLLMDKDNGWLGPEAKTSLRETQDSLHRYLENMDAIRERSIALDDARANQLSEQLNKRMFVLSMITALFLPLSFMTGLLGVNLAGIPLADNVAAFGVFVATLVLMVALQVWYFRRRGWI
ncbi:zinc transporter ZntB [Zobellella maritima]|uniref:zinc transporter ZntB n=1 Tax=Zobellella maritima TaxID=2059725 RepID=UPI000E30A291|nr:zinc transporter ZntB [Zobellella maritima]